MRLPQPREGRERSRGLGDTVAQITKMVGIAPCGGCQRRRELLNRLFAYRKTAVRRQ